jgi:hypothetical protein
MGDQAVLKISIDAAECFTPPLFVVLRLRLFDLLHLWAFSW